MLLALRNGRSHNGRRSVGVSGVLLALFVAATLLPLATLPAEAAPGVPVLHEQTDPHLIWSGSWSTVTASGPSGGSHAMSASAGASVSLAFYGTGVDVLGMTGPKCGIASVSVDGGTPVSADSYAAATAFGQTIYSSAALPNGLHTLTVTVTGTKQPASADAYVALDALSIVGEAVGYPVQQDDSRIVKRGTWTTNLAEGLSGGSHMFTNVAGNEVAVAFSGTQLDLVGMTGPKFGIASVSVDGGAPVDVDLYSAGTQLKARIFTTGPLGDGAHTLKLTCSGRKNAAATDSYVGLDAALPTGTLTQAVMRYEEIEPRLAWNGQLTAGEFAGLSGGRYVWAGPGWGASAVSFAGSRLDWVAVTGPQYGIASIMVDGAGPIYVDLYAPELRCQQVVWSTGALPSGQHTVVISWTGQKNGAASGTYISYDAYDIAGEPVQAPVPPQPVTISFNYPWVRYIVVDKSDLRLYYVVNGALVKSYPCATGKPSTPTPNAIWRIDAKYYTDPTSVYGPRKMRLFRQSGSSYVFTAYAIHGTDTDSSVGTYASHGCIRMHNYDVLEFFDMVPLGTMVVTRQ